MTYAAEVLADSPSGYWKLDETSGTVAADAAGANPGTYVNAPALGEPSLLLNGVGSAVRTSAASSQKITLPGNPISTNGTFEMWIRWTSGALFGDSSPGLDIWTLGDNFGQIFVRAAGVQIGCSTYTDSLRDGRRHHFVIRKSGTSVIVYIDNEIVGFTNIANNTPGVMPWTLGLTISTYGDATFDEVAIYPTALSSARISAHYVAGGTELLVGGTIGFADFGGRLTTSGGPVVAVTGGVEKVTVSFYATHPSSVDLQFFLTSPDGRQALIVDRWGSGADFGTSAADADRTTMDDDAATAIFDGDNPFVGPFRPDNPLDLFVGGSSDGVWELLVVDTSTGGAGTLQAASLFITIASVTTRQDFAAGLPLAIPDDDPGGASVTLAVSTVVVEVSGGASLSAVSSFAPTAAVFTPITPPPSGVRAPDTLFDPVTAVSYAWPLNHTEEDPLSFSRQYQNGAKSSVGLNRHQEASDPPRWRLQGTILDPAQKSTLDALYEACDDRTLEFYDFAGDAYVVTITSWDVRPERTIRNPITGGYFIWRFTLEMEIITAFTGSLAVVGLTP